MWLPRSLARAGWLTGSCQHCHLCLSLIITRKSASEHLTHPCLPNTIQRLLATTRSAPPSSKGLPKSPMSLPKSFHSCQDPPRSKIPKKISNHNTTTTTTKQARKLQATLVRNYAPPTHSLTGVKCRATSVAKKLSIQKSVAANTLRPLTTAR